MIFIGIILIFIGAFLIAYGIIVSQQKNNSQSFQQNLINDLLNEMLSQHFISEEQYENIISMDNINQFSFIQEQAQLLNQSQQQLLLDQLNLQNLQFQDLMLKMSTGIEFGGFNPDLNLNPGMQLEQQNQINDTFNQMNNNNFGGPGMF